MDQSKLILSCKMPKGKEGIIRKLDGPAYHVERLRELGFNEGVKISRISDDAFRCVILNLKGAKIYLNEAAAHTILVELV